MSDDTLPSVKIDPLEARVVVFRQQPEAKGFAELRQILRDAGRGELLAELCATWAQHERDPIRAADAWSEAGEAMVVLGEIDTAMEYLRTSLELDPTNYRAADRLLEIVEPTDPAAAVEIIEHELGELAKRDKNKSRTERGEIVTRRAAQHRRAAELWNDHLGRVDRALWHWQQAWRLEPQRTEALDAARQLYLSLGDEGMVAKLYQAELEVLGSSAAAAARKAHIRYELGVLALRGGDLEGAANHLEEATKLEPTSLEIAEKLAEVYASPNFREGQTRHKAGELFVEVGRRRLTRDDATGINYLRRAVGIDPYSKGSSVALEEALQGQSQWDELDRALRHRTAIIQDPAERAEILRRRAALYRTQKPDRASLIEVLTELLAYERPGSKIARELRDLLNEDQDWEAVSRLMEAEINALGQDPETPAEALVGEILELATVAREHMGDRDRAAELLHQALGVMPTHEEALARYVDHFRERRDWRGLIDLSEFALDNMIEAGADADEIVRRLEEIAQLAELRLGDIDRSVEAWERIREYEPSSPKVAEAMRRLTARSTMWKQLVTTLEAEVANAVDPVIRINALKKMAQTYRERQIDPRRAIELYEQVVQANPDDDQTLKALMELYEREGDDAGLASSLRRLLELEEHRQLDSLRRSGKPVEPGARSTGIEWPVAKRTERLTQMRRLALLYETRLADVDGVVYACSGVLELLTGDRDALDRMERVLEKAGDPRLEQTLEYHAQSSTSPAERAKVLKRLAKLAEARQDDVTALDRWEQTLRTSPSDPDALQALSTLYDKVERWAELAQVLERLDGGKPLPPQGTPEAAIRSMSLERYATILDSHLDDAPRATRAWHRVLELSPKNRTALDALSRLYRTASKWRELADILGSQAVLFAASSMPDDRERACLAAMERAEIFEGRLGAPGDAIKVLDHLIRELNPNHLDAHTALRRLHEARGDFDAAVRVAEREMYLSPDPIRKVARGLEIGLMCRDRLNNATRALQAFKRVLELDPEQDEALAATADLLAKLGRWKEHVAMLERMLAFAPGRDDPSIAPEHAAGWAEHRRSLVQRIAAATADKLNDPKAAFRWWRRAHDEAPDEQTLSDVRRAGEAYGLWRELSEVLTDERKRLVAMGASAGRAPSEAERYVALSRELAGLHERRLADKPRASAVLAEALAVKPRDGSLLAEIERLANELDSRQSWKLLLDAYEIAFAAHSPAERVELYLRRARILEERVNDSKGAVTDVLSAFSWAPDRDDIREALVALAGKARAWNEVVAVDGALAERAATVERRVTILRRRAQVIEDQLKDAPRAFRTHLIALLLSPDDADTASHLWRLARVIGRYRDVDRAPAPEMPTAVIAIGMENPYSEVQPRPSRPLPGVASLPGMAPIQTRIPRRAQTDPIEEHELANLTVGDSTQPLDVTEIEMAAAADKRNEFKGENPTMTLSPQDLRGMMVPPKNPAKQPPKPPPRPPTIQRAKAGTIPPPPPTGRLGLPGTAPRKAQAPVRRPPLPTLSNRSYESPWEELALTYEGLPAADTETRLRWLYRASEVWETGGKDIARAFDALARAFVQARRSTVGDGEVRGRLQRVAQEHKAWDRLADLYEGLAESAETATQAADLLMEVAQIRAEQKRPREAEAQLRRILGMLPNDEVSRTRLEELYRGEGRWIELAASLEERTDPRLGTAAPEAERPLLLHELASIYTERLNRPHDAIDAFERLRLIAPSDIEVLFNLSGLYGKVGRWSKVIETLARVEEIAEGSPQARDALHTIARIYVKELELPERAVEAYARLVTTWPDDSDAWSALDNLYQDSARWTELADVLRRRAALERDPVVKAQLLSRRAQVLLEWLNSPEEAAAALRHARTVAPDDAAIGDLLVTALSKAGSDREAAAILEDRIDSAQAPATSESHAESSRSTPRLSRGELAALHIRLAQLRHEKLADQAGARDAIEQALLLVPEHPTALGVLANLASPDDDPQSFATAKLREAEGATDDDAKIAALMVAGDVLQSRVGDTAGARASYERVLALRPYHSEATWALAGLVEKGGDPDTAGRLLEKRLDDESLTPPEKARIMTQLAALSRAAGVEPAAERRLLEALGCVPDHIPAIIALADFYADAARWNDLEAFLREVVDVLTKEVAPAVVPPPALIADLHRRLAMAHEKLGRDEDAYQTLVAADRLHRGHLLIKLALGENRYKARRWREATLHLSPLAAHEDAARYPSEVAQGLYHAALAEIRSLRPEKAPPLYTRALELKPSYAPALQALAEIAMEQGDHRRAADLLTRQATATEVPDERMRLFEALGDMALMMLKDDERARTCYAAAVAAAQPLEARHVSLLEKLLDRQQLAGDPAGSARTAELLAAFGTTPSDRASRYLRAARDYLASGDRERARGAADRAVESDPYDVDAVDLASGLAIDLGDVDAAAAMLTRMLTAKGERDPSPTASARRALLMYRLGAARQQRGDIRQALPAYERAIQLAPASEGATHARRGLVDLVRAGEDPSKRDSIGQHLQAITASTGALSDLVAWAEELRRLDRADVGRTAIDLAIACGHSADVHQSAFLSIHKHYTLRDDENYRAALDATERQLLTDPEEAAMSPIALALAEASALLWPELEESFARAGVAGAKRVPATLHVAAVSMFPRLTTALGTGAVILYSSPAGQHPSGADVTVVAAATPVIVLGPRLADGSAAPAETRALLARAVELTRPEHIAFAGLPISDATKLLASVARLFGPPPVRDVGNALVEDEDLQRGHDELVKGSLSVKIRSRLEQVLSTMTQSSFGIERYIAACNRTADRAALLLDGDAAAIARHASHRGEAHTHLISAVAQPGWLPLRHKLGLGVR